MGIDRKYGNLGGDAGKQIPGDEPVFIIRAKDRASIPAILGYAKAAYEVGADTAFVDDVIATVKRFENWQKANAGIVKTPD